MSKILEELKEMYNYELGICEACHYDDCIYEDCGTYNYLKELDIYIQNEIDKTSI